MLPVGGLTVNVCATVQKLKRPACGEFSIPSGTRGYVTSGFIHAQNSGTIRATRPLGRGTVCPRIDDSRLRGNDKFMIYDLKAEGSQVLDCGFRIADWRRSGSGTAQPPACGGQSTQNKANCPQRGTEAVSGGRDTPAFHCSIIPPSPPQARWDKARGVGDKGANAKNEPNSSIADCGFRTDLWRNARCGRPPSRRMGCRATKCAKRTQSPAGPGGTRPHRRGARGIVRNKAKLGQAGVSRGRHTGGACCAKRSQFPEAGHRGGVSIADCGLGIADWEQTCDETPLRQRHAGRGASCQTNPIGRNESYETKPIGPPGRCRVGRPTHSLSLRAGSTKNRGPIVQNKPNCPKRGTEAVSAGVAVKSPHYCSFPLFQHSNPQCWAGRGLEDGRHGVPPPPLAPPTLPRENSSEN
jgi:hypothetical protein